MVFALMCCPLKGRNLKEGVSTQTQFLCLSAPASYLARRAEARTYDESDRAVQIARITSLAEEVLGDDAIRARFR
jgi:uncharacterized protein (DUF2384 family)